MGSLFPPSTSYGKTTKTNKQRKSLGHWPLQKKSLGSRTSGAKTNIWFFRLRWFLSDSPATARKPDGHFHPGDSVPRTHQPVLNLQAPGKEARQLLERFWFSCERRCCLESGIPGLPTLPVKLGMGVGMLFSGKPL